jgi:MFS transporter, MHS family, proline/betaine transporter
VKFKSVIAASFGNILEWYDFALFTVYASIFATLFFPKIDHYAGTIAVFGIFAAGFICRPLGAIIFGHFGDRLGRIKTLRASVLCISVPTLLIGFLPTYDSIGLWAAVILTVLRLFQGICLGGEYTGVIIYLTEMAPDKHRGFLASFAGTGANLGILLATVVVGTLAAFMPATFIQEWAWRLPFLLGGILGLLVYFFRLGLTETHVFEKLAQKAELVKVPLWEVIQTAPWQVARIVGLVCAGSTFYYLCFVYLSTYLTQVSKLTQQHASQLQSFFLLLMLLLVPLAGIVSDRVGRKRMFLWMITLLMLTVVPGFYLLSTGYVPYILIALAIFTVISSMEQGTTSATVVENFPARVRYTGVALGYNIGNALFGGSAPMIAAWLLNTTGNPLSPAFYLMFVASITLVVVVFYLRETRHKSLLGG